MTDDWIAFHLYTESVQDLQPLLESVVTPFAAAHAPPLRWFFLRYRDHIGPHVRLRFGGPLDLLARVQRSGLAELPSMRIRLYQPEYAKFGGVEGIAAAERLFQASSATAIGCFGPGYWPRRLATAALSLTAVTSHLSSDDRRAFLAETARYWLARTGLGEARAARLAAPFRAALSTFHAEQGTQAMLDGYAHTLRAALPPQPIGLLYQHVHLMNNRLGLTPVEEALLAQALS